MRFVLMIGGIIVRLRQRFTELDAGRVQSFMVSVDRIELRLDWLGEVDHGYTIPCYAAGSMPNQQHDQSNDRRHHSHHADDRGYIGERCIGSFLMLVFPALDSSEPSFQVIDLFVCAL